MAVSVPVADKGRAVYLPYEGVGPRPVLQERRPVRPPSCPRPQPFLEEPARTGLVERRQVVLVEGRVRHPEQGQHPVVVPARAFGPVVRRVKGEMEERVHRQVARLAEQVVVLRPEPAVLRPVPPCDDDGRTFARPVREPVKEVGVPGVTEPCPPGRPPSQEKEKVTRLL